MKIKLINSITLLAALVAVAWVDAPFRDWIWVKKNSPDIVIALCGPKTAPAPGVYNFNGPDFDSKIYVASTLKGSNCTRTARLKTDYPLQQGEAYLVFGQFDDGIYNAFDEYRVIPLGKPNMDSLINSITNKPLDEQLQILFKRGIDHLDQKIQELQLEKQRLKTGLNN